MNIPALSLHRYRRYFLFQTGDNRSSYFRVKYLVVLDFQTLQPILTAQVRMRYDSEDIE